jgi:hypothetical protein
MDTLGSGAWEEAGAMEGLWKLWSQQRSMDNGNVRNHKWDGNEPGKYLGMEGYSTKSPKGKINVDTHIRWRVKNGETKHCTRREGKKILMAFD